MNNAMLASVMLEAVSTQLSITEAGEKRDVLLALRDELMGQLLDISLAELQRLVAEITTPEEQSDEQHDDLLKLLGIKPEDKSSDLGEQPKEEAPEQEQSDFEAQLDAYIQQLEHEYRKQGIKVTARKAFRPKL